jgi:NitT/TauT family transport system substrate-binding protein
MAEAGASTGTGVNAARALAEGQLDGFWANALAAQVAVHRGIGEVILDARRGDGPPGAGNYTFTALETTEAQIGRNPQTVEGVIRAVVRAQALLRADPARARDVGARLFPPLEVELIDQVIRRDVVFYDASVTQEAFAQLSDFAQSVGLLHEPAPDDQVVATNFRNLWSTVPSAFTSSRWDECQLLSRARAAAAGSRNRRRIWTHVTASPPSAT